MIKPLPVDSRNVVMSVGDLVVYTTNTRHSGLNFGRISVIKEKEFLMRDGTPSVEYKIRMDSTDAFGNTKFDWEWIDGKKVDIDRPSRSGLVEYSSHKFLVL